jgi:hypothetical protein
MTDQLKDTYRGIRHTTPIIFEGEGYNPQQFPMLLKGFIAMHWNGFQFSEDSKIIGEDITVLNHACVQASDDKWVVTVQWEFV